jgi:peptidoglycan/xylan/chitin deacetylase (PgdA/CDA1 family)
VLDQTPSGVYWRVLAGVVFVVLALAACSSAKDPGGSSAPDPGGTPGGPPTSQPNAAPAGAPPPEFTPPYPFGAVQQKAPPVIAGSVPVIRQIPTDKPYVFITVDDGAVQDPSALRLIQQSGAHPVLFLNQMYVKGHEAYFRAILDASGAVLGDHTMNHPDLRGKPFEFQRNEICGDADYFQHALGQRPTLFRPPFGSFDATTLKAAAACGMHASVQWTATVNDGVVRFQVGRKLRPGDIVLMHFRKTFTADYTAFLNRAKMDGLTPVPLADFLG